MNKTLENIQIQKMLPHNINTDDDVSSLLQTISNEMNNISKEIKQLLFYPNISELPEPIINLLAEQFQVTFYSALGLDLDTKRELVKNAIVWNKRKGTKAVMQEMLAVLYSSEVIIQEWFEFDGEPYTFRLVMDNMTLNEGDIDTIMYIINELKNVRSHLESITVKLKLYGDLYIGYGAVKYRKQKLVPIMDTATTISTLQNYIGVGVVRYRKQKLMMGGDTVG